MSYCYLLKSEWWHGLQPEHRSGTEEQLSSKHRSPVNLLCGFGQLAYPFLQFTHVKCGYYNIYLPNSNAKDYLMFQRHYHISSFEQEQGTKEMEETIALYQPPFS
ncbi:hypothetical protein KIL84_021997 [Mauremys mutica]|uniref:Uncharacterized protein n=1 Tax=Mauremys mutica TaxID=74926 RepID=A0A9D4B3Q3_9SAUR|nr:hypothetical protein KIL84_021997 [Mauremys mutica]